MTSELSKFAARLRKEIELNATDAATRLSEDSRFNALALELFRLQFDHNPPYRRLAEARSTTPGQVSHWSRLPAVPTPAFKDFEFSCLPHEQRTRVFHSSGTTVQTPSRHFHSPESLAVYETAVLADFHGRVLPGPDSERTSFDWMMLTPGGGQAPNSSLVHMFETIRRAVRAPETCFAGYLDGEGRWNLEVARLLDACRKSIIAGRPVFLLGTAFSFVHLLDAMAERNLRLDLPPGSRALETGGYKGRSRTIPKSELRDLIEYRLGIPVSRVVSEYGMSELSSQAYDRRVLSAECGPRTENAEDPGARRLFQFPPWARWQVVSPEDGSAVVPGETGLLRVFDLANVFSVMAIQTEDLAVRRDDGFDLIGRREGSEPRGCSLMTADVLGTLQSALRTPLSR